MSSKPSKSSLSTTSSHSIISGDSITSSTSIYEPREDSYLLQRYIREYAFGRVLDMGTGSGILALSAIMNPNVREVVAVDINLDAVDALREKVKKERLRKMTIIESDLFAKVDGQFHLIVFNPPYLPQDVIGGEGREEGRGARVISDAALYGGKKGWEISDRFFSEVGKYLFAEGMVLFLFSSLTNKEKVEEILVHNMMEFRELERLKIPFEELYVYEVRKSGLLRELEKKAIEGIHYFAKGSRGVIFVGKHNLSTRVKKMIPLTPRFQTVAIKVENLASKAEGTIRSEALWLERLNAEGIGPRLLFAGEVEGEEYVVYEFVEGEYLEDWLAGADTKEVEVVFTRVLEQCFVLDLLKVSKEEMHRPLKHVIVQQNLHPILIDFERTKATEKPQNVTQFLEYICRVEKELEKKEIRFSVAKVREAARLYKSLLNREQFECIIDLLFAKEGKGGCDNDSGRGVKKV